MFKLRLLLCILPFLAITSVLGGSYGGYGSLYDEAETGSDLPDDQVQEVLALYRKHCRSMSTPAYGVPPPSDSGGYGYGPSSSANGQYGPPSSSSGHPSNVHIICKEGNESHAPPKKQIIRIPTQKPKKNIIFVEAPTLKYKHNINLISNGVQNPAVKIYVLPQKSSHQLKLWDKRGPSSQAKPQVFFLKGDKPSSESQPSYGVPQPQPQPPVVESTTPTPDYGVLPVTTYRPPISSYGGGGGYDEVNTARPPQLEPPTQPNQGYGATNLPPKQYAIFPDSGGNLVPFDPSTLGPEYEIVPVDQGTRDAYQHLFASGGGQLSASASQSQPQFTFQTEASYDTDSKTDTEPSAKTETLVQPLSSSNLYKSIDSNGAYAAGGRLQFPSESIQNYQIQPFSGGKKTEKTGVRAFPGAESGEEDENEEMTDAEAAKSLKALISAYEQRQSTSTSTPSSLSTSTPQSTTTTISTSTTTPKPTTSSTTTPTPTGRSQPRKLTTNIFDQAFVQTLIASALRSSTPLPPTTSSFAGDDEYEFSSILRLIPPRRNSRPQYVNSNSNSQIVERYFRNTAAAKPKPPGDQLQLPSFSSPAAYRTVTSLKREVKKKPGFEIFPADFVSYSYSKEPAENNAN